METRPPKRQILAPSVARAVAASASSRRVLPKELTPNVVNAALAEVSSNKVLANVELLASTTALVVAGLIALVSTVPAKASAFDAYTILATSSKNPAVGLFSTIAPALKAFAVVPSCARVTVNSSPLTAVTCIIS
jgi:hypothetical protein